MDLVVVNYRTPKDLAAFLVAYDEVKDEIPTKLWIYNVDPTGEDISTAFVASGVDVDHIITDATNCGYARACNYAATQGDGEIIGFFNADTRLRPGVLQEIVNTFEQADDIGIVGPKQVDEDRRITHAGIFGTNAAPKLRGWKERDLDGSRYIDIRTDAVSVSGSAYFVRRSVWDELTACEHYRVAAPDAEGAFLPTQHYYEETFCSYHARAHGHRVVYAGTAEMVHRWHKASPVGGFAEKVMPESRSYFRYACDIHGIEHD